MSIKTRLRFVTVLYWFLLLYIVAALIWWFVELSQQNNDMAQMRLVEINKDDPRYMAKVDKIAEFKKRKQAQYLGEGVTFLGLILICALIVYRGVRKQIKLSQQQQNFMMAITHELKTPIAVAQLNLETLVKRKLDESQQQRLINNTLQETERLNDLCNNILLTSQLESGVNRFTKEEVDLVALAGDCVAQFRRRFPAREIGFHSAGEAAVFGDPLLLQLLVNNLLENALKYSTKEKPVFVSVKSEAQKTLLLIGDEGNGITAEEKEKVFEKFYRIGDERTRTSKGTGLGLYLCKKIMADHKGDITVTDNQPQGSIFTASWKNT